MDQRINQDEAPEGRPNLRADDGTMFIYSATRGVYEPYKRSNEEGQTQGNHTDGKSTDGFRKHWHKHWRFWVTTLVSVLTLTVVAIYTFFAGRQTRASEEAVAETKNAVRVASDTLQHTKDQEAAQAIIDAETRRETQKAARDSLTATIDSFHRDQRAWIGITIVPSVVQAGLEFTPGVIASNTGRTPARNAIMSINTAGLPRGVKVDFDHLIRVPASGLVFPGGVMKATARNLFHAGLQQTTYDNYRRGDILITVFGKVTYDDVFKRHHWVTFCYEVDPSDASTYNICSYGNEIDSY